MTTKNRTASTLLRQQPEIVSWVNAARSELHLPHLAELPDTPELGYDLYTCPIALALGGSDGDYYTIGIESGTITTQSQDVANALGFAWGIDFRYSYETFSSDSPPLVKNFVKLFDTIIGTEDLLYEADTKLRSVANSTFGYADQPVW